jgi:V/A-type H+-transporting ATPase subunit C
MTIPTGPAPYIYVTTRLRARKAGLIDRREYPRLLNMSLESFTRFIHESGYHREIAELAFEKKGIDLIEAALTRNFARSFHSVLRIAPGHLRILAARYLHRWDIINIMVILRAKSQQLPAEQVRGILIPAGELEEEFLLHLINEESVSRVIDLLEPWRLSNVLRKEFSNGSPKGIFSRVENELYKHYYADLIRDAESGIKGGDIFVSFLRLEIDVTNIKNLFRLRNGGITGTVHDILIPGGTIHNEEYARLARTEDRDAFIALIEKTTHFSIFSQAFNNLHKDISPRDDAVADLLWKRWNQKKSPVHPLEIAITRVMLNHMEGLSKRHPFSVLPILVYFERKRYEIANMRAIARGKEAQLTSTTIAHYLVI